MMNAYLPPSLVLPLFFPELCHVEPVIMNMFTFTYQLGLVDLGRGGPKKLGLCCYQLMFFSAASDPMDRQARRSFTWKPVFFLWSHYVPSRDAILQLPRLGRGQKGNSSSGIPVFGLAMPFEGSRSKSWRGVRAWRGIVDWAPSLRERGVE